MVFRIPSEAVQDFHTLFIASTLLDLLSPQIAYAAPLRLMAAVKESLREQQVQRGWKCVRSESVGQQEGTSSSSMSIEPLRGCVLRKYASEFCVTEI